MGKPIVVRPGEGERIQGPVEALETAPAGSFVFVPRGTPHNFQNVGSDAARILVMFTPAGMERFFERFAEPSDEPAPERFAGIGREVSMEVVGPPLRGA
jgi:uncharacterized RmlC-like cupin family protein